MLKKLNRKLTKYLEGKYPNWDVSIALRYLPVVSDLGSKFESEARILDVGSGEFGLATYTKGRFDITGTDIDFGKNRKKNLKIVKASAENLPFKDSSFDAVVSVDMMEHLPQNIRQKAVSEMVRIAKSKVYILCPRGRFSKIIDGLLSKYYQFTHKSELGYLSEHQKYELPSENSIEGYIYEALKKYNKTAKVEKKGNTNAILWLILLLLGFSEVKILTSFYHKLLLLLPILNLMHFWPTYRVEYIVDMEDYA
ncbi:hypothetical protein A2V56_00075 [Candidatus Woesebacteria bacterium RBG_19FT_COMBO_42_9]|uniref:Methyltransferase type 11 domain-containing protein n=1 Tax=Candidatus Woesebacteria bacterium RBG_16_42_24 TaxID=1802485 RepID=A0A1F7XKF4_9BACT|nr:MAG: hypothetical protein A2V97_02530 [Candidatus Woesebacteria bacterium RBG_16_42_24]OGM16633.1 MAG: hypothetical protein A2V56_00075 [Candidatus Woesebacteria bacterium RBG_19FT_COMBO_42_9]OGM68182.1 MAG: hypothetical protein A2985_04140 [Candidatus Woesebacteria bacterium RIFCSPLOWO2_01_FULL_43_11]